MARESIPAALRTALVADIAADALKREGGKVAVNPLSNAEEGDREGQTSSF